MHEEYEAIAKKAAVAATACFALKVFALAIRSKMNPSKNSADNDVRLLMVARLETQASRLAEDAVRHLLSIPPEAREGVMAKLKSATS